MDVDGRLSMSLSRLSGFAAFSRGASRAPNPQPPHLTPLIPTRVLYFYNTCYLLLLFHLPFPQV
jgi:hypothetical protein